MKRRILSLIIAAQSLCLASAIAQSAASTNQSPKAMSVKECEDGVCTEWTFFGTQGQGKMPSGSDVNLAVTNTDPKNFEIKRLDITGSTRGSELFYTGTLHGDSMGGEIWTKSGKQGEQKGYWTGSLQKTPEGLPRRIRSCGPHNFVMTWNDDHYDSVEDGHTEPGPTFRVISYGTGESGVRLHRIQRGASADYIGHISSEGVIEGTQNWRDDSGKTWNGEFRLTYGTAFDTDCKGAPQGSRTQAQQGVVVFAPVAACFVWFFGLVCN